MLCRYYSLSQLAHVNTRYDAFEREAGKSGVARTSIAHEGREGSPGRRFRSPKHADPDRGFFGGHGGRAPAGPWAKTEATNAASFSSSGLLFGEASVKKAELSGGRRPSPSVTDRGCVHYSSFAPFSVWRLDV
ncbi:hypothetical protein MRX96_022561 [Rhipicephalus microplus]